MPTPFLAFQQTSFLKTSAKVLHFIYYLQNNYVQNYREIGYMYISVCEYFLYDLNLEKFINVHSSCYKIFEDNNFIDISKRTEYLHWEGSGDFRRGDILTRIDEIEDDVRRKSPYQASNLQRGIQSILIQASLDSNEK